MKRLSLAIMAITTLAVSTSPAPANDIVKALRAYRDLTQPRYVSSPRDRYVDDRYDRRDLDRYRPARTCDSNRTAAARRELALREYEARHVRERLVRERLEREAYLRAAEARRRVSRSRDFGVHVRFQTSPRVVPANPVLPIPELPPTRRVVPDYVPPSRVYPSPVIPTPVAPRHAIGEIVSDCHETLYRGVRIRQRRFIACNARPITVAVKHPRACAHACTCCDDNLAFIKVMAPPCPPRSAVVSPCGRKICLNFGHYKIDILTERGFVKVIYNRC